MKVFSLGCVKKNPTHLILRGDDFECVEPEDEFMISPLLTEAYGPLTTLVAGSMIYLTHAPVSMNLKAGVRINCPLPGVGSFSLDLFADGQKMTDTPIVVSTQTLVIPQTGLKSLWRTIPAGTRLDCQVVSFSNPDAYPGFRGLQVAFMPRAIDDPA